MFRRAAKRSRSQSSVTPASACSDSAVPGVTTANCQNDNADNAINQESDSEEETDDEFSGDQDAAQELLDIPDIIQTAQQERVMASTRSKYVGHLRQMACWAESTEQFKHCVVNGEMQTPLDTDCMVGYTQHLRNHKVPWRHHEVPGTMTHLAVKSVSGFFAAAKDSYGFHGKEFPEAVSVYFSNFIRGYSLSVFLLLLKTHMVFMEKNFRKQCLFISAILFEDIHCSSRLRRTKICTQTERTA
jgi:hypothetical protein